MGETSIDRREAEQLAVSEVMVTRPKTVQRDAPVAEVRRLFERPSLRTLVVVDGDAFCGVIERDDVPDSVPDDAPASGYIRTVANTVVPDERVGDVMALLERNPEGRLVVVDRDGVTLRGLLCLKSDRERFCGNG